MFADQALLRRRLSLAAGWQVQNVPEKPVGQMALSLTWLASLQAWRRGDFQRFGEYFSQLLASEWKPEKPSHLYLLAEYHRTQGKLTEAVSVARRMKRDPLSDWAWYNVGVTAWQLGDDVSAREALRRVARGHTRNLEQFELQSRARLILALLNKKEPDGRQDKRREAALLTIETGSRHGADALALVAFERLERGDAVRAQQAYGQLMQLYGDPLAQYGAWYGQPRAIELVEGGDVAYVNYEHASALLGDRVEALTALLPDADTPLAETIAAYAAGYGQDLLTNWLSREDVHIAWRQWTWLDTQVRDIANRRMRVENLADVTQAQAIRVERARSLMDASRHELSINHLASVRDNAIAHFGRVGTWRLHGTELESVMSARETADLADIVTLRARATSLGAEGDFMSRLDRLESRVRFTAFRAAHHRAAERVAALKAIDIDRSRARVALVRGATERVVNPEVAQLRLREVSAGLDALDDQAIATRAGLEATLRSRLTDRTEQVLADMREELARIQLAMARIADARLLAAGETP